jgi:hypothetical protein
MSTESPESFAKSNRSLLSAGSAARGYLPSSSPISSSLLVERSQFDEHSWLWRHTSSLPIYVLPLAAALGSYLFFLNQFSSSHSQFLKNALPSIIAMFLFVITYIALKKLRREIRHHNTNEGIKPLLIEAFALALVPGLALLTYTLLSDKSLGVNKFAYLIPIAVIGFIALLYVAVRRAKENGKLKDQKNNLINQNSRNFCFFIAFLLIMGFCSAFGAYAFWNMLLGQVAGIIMGAIFLIANGFLLGRDYLDLLTSKKENKDVDQPIETKKNNDLIGKLFNLIGTIGILLGFNYEIVTLLGVKKTPDFQKLSWWAWLIFVVTIIASLFYCFFAICNLQNFKLKPFSKAEDELVKELQGKGLVKYKDQKRNWYRYASMCFIVGTAVAILFNNIAFSSGSFTDVFPHDHTGLVTAIWLYSLLALIPGTVLLSRGYWNKAQSEYYERRANLLIEKSNTLLNDDDDSSIKNLEVLLDDDETNTNKEYSLDDSAEYTHHEEELNDDETNTNKAYPAANDLKRMYEEELKNYYENYDERVEKKGLKMLFPTKKSALWNSLELLGIGLQFAGPIYLVWSPESSFKLPSQDWKIGLTCFIFALFVIAAGLKCHNIHLNNIKTRDELQKTVVNLGHLVKENFQPYDYEHYSHDDDMDNNSKGSSPSNKLIIMD